MKKKIIAMLLCVVLVFAAFPVAAFAANTRDAADITRWILLAATSLSCMAAVSTVSE